MQPLTFDEIAELIQHSRTTKIAPQPIQGDPGKWALYAGQYRVHNESFPFTVLYLYSDATREIVERLLKSRSTYTADSTHVVYPDSLKKQKWFDDVFRFVDKKWTTRDYLRSFIKDDLDKYLSRLSENRPQHYIDPRIETPSGFTRRVPNPVLSLLVDPDPGSGVADGMLGVVLADPGQGKTYMCQKLVAALADRGIVPIYINASQWDLLAAGHLKSLWKTIVHSFTYFDSSIAWLDGHEDQFLRVALKADLFRIVFDGFDEYVLWNKGRVDPLETLEVLSALVAETGSRAVITCRTAYWETQLPTEDLAEFVTRTRSAIYRILPFDLSHARNYFEVRFDGKPELQQRGLNAFTNLQDSDASLAGRGFFLNLIADLVERGLDKKFAQSSGHGVAWAIRALCEREVRRQHLPVNVDEQLLILRQFAVWGVVDAEGATTDTLILIVADTVDRLKDGELSSFVDKLGSHPLVGRNAITGRWAWNQEQLELALIAESLLDLVRTADMPALRSFFEKAVMTSSRWIDLADIVVDLARVDLMPLTSEMCRLLLLMSTPLARGFAVQLAQTETDRRLPKGADRKERAEMWSTLLGGNPLKGLRFDSSIMRFDLSGITFVDCSFERVVWANCQFSDSTSFKNCTFVGGGLANCGRFGLVSLESDCTLDPDAKVWINGAQVVEGKRLYGANDLKSDLKAVLDRFVGKGGIGLKTVEVQFFGRGAIQGSRHRDEILTELQTTVVSKHDVSGSDGGALHVRPEAVEAMKFYATNNVLTGPLSVAYERLRIRLCPHG